MTTAAGGVYLHIPFCSAICPYCDFSVVADRASLRAPLVSALEHEILQTNDRWPELTELGVDTVYFGGGTPSLLTEADLARLLSAVASTFRVHRETRIFLEANPEDVDPEATEAWRRLGVSTLSLGVQSFDDEELRFLGRRHTGAQARRAVATALEAGFETVSLDLIYALPGQGSNAWWTSLDTALELAPQHLSCYGLEVHRQTPFGKRRDRGELRELAEDEQASFFVSTHKKMIDQGFPAYEVSNFARSAEHRSRHNQKYWYHVPYAGFGPSAHAFSGRRRSWNERSLARWQKAVRESGSGLGGEEILTDEDLALETLMLGLRTTEGVDLAAFIERFGYDLEAKNGPEISRQIVAGHLVREGETLRPTLEGWAIADALTTRFDTSPP